MSRPRFVPEGVPPLPWFLEKDCPGEVFCSSEGELASVGETWNEEDASFIAHACSAYQELAERLESILAASEVLGVEPTLYESTDNTADADSWAWELKEAAALLQRCREFAERGGRSADAQDD